MTPKRPSGRERGDEGFTLLETLVQVLLVSLALGLLSFVALAAYQAWTKTAAAVERRAQTSVFLAALDQLAARVSVPVNSDPNWGASFQPSAPGRPLVVPWYRGNPEALLVFSSEAALSLRSWDAEFSLDAAGRWSPLVEHGRVTGVELTLGSDIHTVHFASAPAAVHE